MLSSKPKYFRDPIHGYIKVDEEFQEIVDSPFFQRLRRIKQLAFSDLVYHGAEHSRFGHSLGTYHLASKIAERLEIKGNIKNEFRLAALLHDIGHHPYSHAFESALQKCYREYEHEKYTEAIIMHTEIREKIHKIGLDPKGVVNLIKGTYIDEPEYQFLNDLISSELDVDRLDFLLRDAYFCGVPYGRYDLDRLLLALQQKNNELVVDEKARHAVESFILSRFSMYTQVYTHHTRRAFDLMLGFIFDNKTIKDSEYPKPSSKEIERILCFDDLWLYKKIRSISRSNECSIRKSLSKAILERDPIRRVIERISYSMIEFRPGMNYQRKDSIFTLIEVIEKYKNTFAKDISLDENLIFFDKPWKDLPFQRRYSQYSSREKEEQGGGIKILLKSGEIRDVSSDESSLAFQISNKLAHVIRIYTVKEKRYELADKIVEKHPELKDFVIRKQRKRGYKLSDNQMRSVNYQDSFRADGTFY